jgi:hypothetical protein
VAPLNIKRKLLTSTPTGEKRGLGTSPLVFRKVAEQSRVENTYKSLRREP